jgi:FAD synthetase
MLKEDAKERTERYLSITRKSLEELKTVHLPVQISSQNLTHLVDMVRNYVNDAQHYREQDKHVTSLACVAYAEGLLDALKYLQLATF